MKPVCAVKLTPDSAIISEQQRSLLAPVRKYRGDYQNNARWRQHL
jgi:hypothetical protein